MKGRSINKFNITIFKFEYVFSLEKAIKYSLCGYARNSISKETSQKHHLIFKLFFFSFSPDDGLKRLIELQFADQPHFF